MVATGTSRYQGGMSRRHTLTGRVVGSVAMALVLCGCPLWRERVCSRGEHAVRAIDAPATGRTCVRDGQAPPSGYEEFPPGQTPKYVDQDR